VDRINAEEELHMFSLILSEIFGPFGSRLPFEGMASIQIDHFFIAIMQTNKIAPLSDFLTTINGS
jgi:hypothetical protein